MNPEILDNEYLEPLKTEMQTPLFAGFWVRAAATIIDAVVLFPLAYISLENMLSWKFFEVEVGVTIAWILYKILMEWKFQATIGKMLMKIKVVNESGNGITLEQSIVRFSFYFLRYMGLLLLNYYLFANPAFADIHTAEDLMIFLANREEMVSSIVSLPLIISFNFVVFDLRKQALHDKLAKTFCIYK